MITKDNIKEILEDLSVKEITKVLNSKKDYVELWVHVANAGFYTTAKPYVYNRGKELNCERNRQLFIEKQDFERMLEENEISNYKIYQDEKL